MLPALHNPVRTGLKIALVTTEAATNGVALAVKELIQLLTAMKENISAKLQEQIETVGIDGKSIDDLIDMRNQINDANIKQESLKGSTPIDTTQNARELNAIYKHVIRICKIAPRSLPEVPTASEEFSFSKTLSRLH